MIALPTKSGSSTGTKISIEKISSTPLILSSALQALAQNRILQLEPPVTTLNENAWTSITNALFEKQCDLIAAVFFGRCGMVQRLSIRDQREESEDSLRLAEIRFLIHPEEATPLWVFSFGYPIDV